MSLMCDVCGVRPAVGTIQRIRPGSPPETLHLCEVHLAERRGMGSGARPLQRTIQRLVENHLSRMVLDGSLQEGDSVTVGLQEGRLDFDVVRKVGEADGVQRASASTPA
jgi:hypothetical protein